MQQIQLNAPFRVRKDTKIRAWRIVTAVVAFALLGQTTMVLRALPGGNVSAAVSRTDDPGSGNPGGGQVGNVIPNPALTQACGLDIGLVLDVSASMDATEITQMKTAMTSFVNAFTGTATEFSVSKFSTDSSVMQSFTNDLSAVKSKISTDLPTSGTGNTNWDSGLARGFDTFDNSHKHRTAKPDLLIIATDGSPNRWGYPTTDPTFDWNTGLTKSVERANTIKSAGTRIVAVSIGGDPLDPAYPNVDYKFTGITGNKIAPPATVDATTDVIKTDFTKLGQVMHDLASGLCGGKILVQKQYDTDGNGTVDLDGSTANALLSGWEFDVNGSPSNPNPQTTINTGALEFNVQNGTYSVTENTTKSRVALTSAICMNGTKTVGQFNATTRTVSGLTMATDQTISCRFVNTKLPDPIYKINLDKSAPATVKAGQNMVYTLDWSVAGDTAITNGVIADPLPAHTTFVSADNGGTFANGKVSWNLGTKNPGDHGTVKVTVKVEKPVPLNTSLKNTACFSVKETKDACDDVTTKIPDPVYDISLDKSGPATIGAGQNMTYNLAWTVGGDTEVTNAVITDPIPANTTFVSADHSGAIASGIVSWNLGTKQPGDHGTVAVTVIVASPIANGTSLKNTACFDTTETKEVCDDVTTKISSAPTISFDKSGPATVTAGGNIAYTLTWGVGGTQAVTNAIVTDPLPANTTFVSADNGGTFANGIVTWNLGSKNPGDHGTVGVTVKTASPIANGTVITNTACFDTTETDQLCDPTTTTINSSPIISITKTNSVTTYVNPGAIVTYTVVVTNAATATDTAKAVNLTDVLPNGFTFVDGGLNTKTFALGDIIPGKSITTTYTVKVSDAQAAGTYTNTATAKGSNTNSVSASSNVEVRVPQTLGIEAKPELTLTKKANPTVTQPNTTVQYTLTIKNTTDVTAKHVVITDTLPKGFVFADTGETSNTWTISELPGGRVITIPYDVKVGADVKNGKYTNVATIKADDVGKKTAKATVEVRAPKVAGLATTGVGPMDYGFFATGLGLIAYGIYLLRRNRKVLA